MNEEEYDFNQVHHAICNLLEPVFERFFISDSDACRKGKGTHRAMRRAQQFSRGYRYFLKLDVCKFFESVDHQAPHPAPAGPDRLSGKPDCSSGKPDCLSGRPDKQVDPAAAGRRGSEGGRGIGNGGSEIEERR